MILVFINFRNQMQNLDKNIIKENYGKIAQLNVKQNQKRCCCNSNTIDIIDLSVMAEDYKNINGYYSEADLGLGCGIPTEFAKIKQGETLLDLGSGAGNDAFIAAKLVGDSGYIIGVDMTEEMIDRANQNKEKLQFKNVEFRFGEIEELPVDSDSIDVVISNCVLNLVPDKVKAFSEIHRVLKTGGRLTVSDIVISQELPEKIRGAAEMYAGCVAGAIFENDYIRIMQDCGIKNIDVVKKKNIIIPDEILEKYLSPQEIIEFRKSENPILSITVYAEK